MCATIPKIRIFILCFLLGSIVHAASVPGGAVTVSDGSDIALGTTTDAPNSNLESSGSSTSIQLLKAVKNYLRTVVADFTAGPQASAGSFSVVPATATLVVSGSFEASHVLKASSGSLVSIRCLYSGATTAYLMVFNSPTVPADGAIAVSGSGSLLEPPIYLPGTNSVSDSYNVPLTASSGISACISSTAQISGTAWKTVVSGSTAFFSAQYQ